MEITYEKVENKLKVIKTREEVTVFNIEELKEQEASIVSELETATRDYGLRLAHVRGLIAKAGELGVVEKANEAPVEEPLPAEEVIK